MAESVGLRVDDPRFWDPVDLRKEVDRIFDVCHSCRLCFKFCGSFPSLFDLIDQKTDERRRQHLAAHPEISAAAEQKRREADTAEVNHAEPEYEVGVTFGDELPELSAHAGDLSKHEIDHVVDQCFQCKLCYPNCPYTPPHDFALDFPRLLLRWKAHRARQQGIGWKTKLLRDSRLIGKLASLVPGLANWALRNPLNRLLMEKVTGIHRRKKMPAYFKQTFPAWWKSHTPRVEAIQAPRAGVEVTTPTKVVLFSTCLIDYNDPQVGSAAVRVLEHNGIEVVWPDKQLCCGMPFLEEGDVDRVRKQMRHNASILAPWIERGYRIVIPSPSCSLMMREEYPQLSNASEYTRIAASTHDLNEYLYRLAREGRLKRDFQRRFTHVKYHVPCHIRLQNIGIRGRDLLRLVAEQVDAVQECSGHDGTWSMQKGNFEESLRWGKKAFEGMRLDAGEKCALACADCRLAALHIEQGAGQTTVHPVVAMAHAYGFADAPDLGGVPVKVEA